MWDDFIEEWVKLLEAYMDLRIGFGNLYLDEVISSFEYSVLDKFLKRLNEDIDDLGDIINLIDDIKRVKEDENGRKN